MIEINNDRMAKACAISIVEPFLLGWFLIVGCVKGLPPTPLYISYDCGQGKDCEGTMITILVP